MNNGQLEDRHARWSETVGAYALGALPADEREEFEDHLRGCARCQEDAKALQAVVAVLPAAADPVKPPPELKARLMAIVRSEAELQHASRREPPPVREGARPRFGGFTLRPLTAAAAAACLLVAGVFGGAALRGDDPEMVRTLSASVDNRLAPRGRATIQVTRGQGTLEVSGMPAAPSGRVYQVWVEESGRGIVATDALFTVTRAGTATIAVPGSLDGVKQVLVTAEPPRGSPAPTRPPIVTAKLS